MKIHPEMANVINILNKDKEDQHLKRIQDARSQKSVADIISVENKQASSSHVENVDQAKALLAHVTENLDSAASGLYNLNLQRISKLIN